MPVTIKGKQYITVAERIQAVHQADIDRVCIETELVEKTDDWVMFKATVTLGESVYTGYATSTFNKGGMEKISPVEVAETSAVGRALGFAGFGIIDGLATADEVIEAQDREAIQVSDNFKSLRSKVVGSQSIEDINNVTNSPEFSTLSLEEKRILQERIGKQFSRFHKGKKI